MAYQPPLITSDQIFRKKKKIVISIQNFLMLPLISKIRKRKFKLLHFSLFKDGRRYNDFIRIENPEKLSPTMI